MRGNTGTSKLAGILKQMAAGEAERPPLLELGTIKSDYSLITDRFPIAIPKKDYLICRSLTMDSGKPLTITSENNEHTHSVELPEKMHPIRPGDRVLVAWVNDGTDAVIIDIVIPG